MMVDILSLYILSKPIECATPRVNCKLKILEDFFSLFTKHKNMIILCVCLCVCEEHRRLKIFFSERWIKRKGTDLEESSQWNRRWPVRTQKIILIEEREWHKKEGRINVSQKIPRPWFLCRVLVLCSVPFMPQGTAGKYCTSSRELYSLWDNRGWKGWEGQWDNHSDRALLNRPWVYPFLFPTLS